MCDQDAFQDMIEHLRRNDALTRRGFGAAALGVGLSAALPRVANAAEVVEQDVEIRTSAGTADAFFVHPRRGKAPAVLVWTDIFGLRPAFRQMGRRLAESGYSVLVPNPFYRLQRAPTSKPGADFNDPETRNRLMAQMGSLNADTAAVDAQAFITWLDGQSAVDRKRRMATTGYCMGGPLVMRTAAARPDRVGAGASFHGGGLVTDKPDSPHLLVPRMKAQVLIAIAANDDERDPNAKVALKAAFEQANLPAEIEVYAGTKHGWCPPDAAVYDEAQAERAWARMLELFHRALA
ncbi:MAG: dienelactone hydrolase family protein [Steroidobacteraceae bacterium]